MILDSLAKPENNPKILAIVVILLVFLYTLLITPLLEKSKQINADIITENELTLFLDTAQQKLSNLSQFPALSKEQAKEQIRTTFLSQEVLLNSLNMNNQSINANINKISFALLFEILQQLKNQSGIIVTSAIIERIEPGIVSAQLTFSNPHN